MLSKRCCKACWWECWDLSAVADGQHLLGQRADKCGVGAGGKRALTIIGESADYRLGREVGLPSHALSCPPSWT